MLSVRVKDKSCYSPEGQQLYEKQTPTHMFSCEYCKSFRDSFFHGTTLAAAFELSFRIRKKNLKRNLVERLPLF